MRNANTTREMEFISIVHARLIAFARHHYALDGRGAVMVTVPPVPPGRRRAVVSAEFTYHALDQLREFTRRVAAENQDSAAAFLCMVETYDPLRYAVVTVILGHALPVSIKMSLEVPVVLPEAAGVH